MSIKAFLETVCAIAKSSAVLRYVTGNQSADMDSVVSAISYAYFYHEKYPSEPPFLPLINITRDELRLRKDIVLLFEKHRIATSALSFIDDVRVAALQRPSSTLEVVLVDHCNLQGDTLISLHNEGRLRVSGIIDHHADEKVFLDANPRIIRSNGSCSALVFNYWNAQLPFIQDVDVISLLLGPLLIDTTNMAHKVEEGDIAAFEQYKKVLSEKPSSALGALGVTLGDASFSSFFTELKAAKKDMSRFSFYDVLRKDYKQFQFESGSGSPVRIGFSSVGKSTGWLLTKFSPAEVVETLEKMSETSTLDVVVITTSYTQKENGTYTREFCYGTQNERFYNLASFADTLNLNSDVYRAAEIEQSMAEVNKVWFFKVFNQQNIAASRKQVVPAVKAIVEHHF